MTLRTSSNRLNPALNMYRFTFKKNIGLIILVSAFVLLVCPGYVLMRINDGVIEMNTPTYNINNITSILSVGLTIATSAIAIIFCFVNFAFLYSKKSGDVFHALPLTRTELLLSRFFAGTVSLLIPMLICYGSLWAITLSPKISGSITLIVTGFVFNILVTLMCAAFSLIFIVCAGSAFDFILSFAGINIGLVFIVLIIMDMCEYFLNGFVYSQWIETVCCVSPFFFGFYKMSAILSLFAAITFKQFVIKAAVVAVKLLLVTAASLIVCALLYNKRKSEKNGEPYAYSFIYAVCSFIISIVGAYALGIIFNGLKMTLFFWLFTAAGAVLTAITFGAITDRGFKTVKKSVVIGVCALAAIAIAAIGFKFDLFGYSQRLPEKANIKSTNLTFNSVNIYTENSELPLNLHKDIIKEIGKTGRSTGDYDNTTFVSLKYTLKNGKTFERGFYIDSDKFSSELLDIYTSEENRYSVKHSGDEIASDGITFSDFGKYTEDGASEPEFTNIPLTKKEMQTILDAYSKDIEKATADSNNSKNVREYYISGHTAEWKHSEISLIIEDSFENTKAAIEALDPASRQSEEVYQ